MSILSSKKQTVHEQGHWEQKTGMTLRSRMLQMACKVKMRTLPWLAIIMGISRHQFSSVQFSHSVVSDSATPWIATYQASLSITNSRSSLRLTSIESVMRSSHLILCRPLLLLPPIPPSIRVFSNESTQAQREPQICTSQDACTAPGILQCWRPLVLLIHRELLLRLGNKYKHLSWLQI